MESQAPQPAATPPPASYVRVKCGDCGNEQVVFRRAASVVNCLVCSTVIAQPGGGVATLNGEIVEELA